MVNRETIQWSTEKPYNGQQRNHAMANRKKHEADKPYNGQQKKNTKEKNHKMVNRKKNTLRETIQWSTEKPYNGQHRNHTMVNR